MKALVLYSIIGASAVAAGAGAGIVYKRCFVAPSEQIVGFNPDNCKPNVEELFAKVEKCGSPEKATEQLEPYEIVQYAFEKYKQCDYSVSYCEGMAKTIIDQAIRSAQVRRKESYFEEQISKSSMVGVGKRMYQEGLEGDTTIHNETSSDSVVIDGDNVHADYKSDVEVLNTVDYKTAWGRNLPDMAIYLIASTTINSQKLEKVDGGYKVFLELQPQKGGYNYRYQMKTISGLDDYPSFQYLNLTYELTENLEMKTMMEESKFHALMGVSVDIENKLNYKYFPNKDYKIPGPGEDFDYKGLKEEK